MPSHAIFVRETGGADRLAYEPQDLEAPGAGQARVRVAAAGVNFIDVYFRSGQYPRPLPFVLGLEGAGVVEALGPECADFSVGDQVAWSAVAGSYADALNAPVGAWLLTTVVKSLMTIDDRYRLPALNAAISHPCVNMTAEAFNRY